MTESDFVRLTAATNLLLRAVESARVNRDLSWAIAALMSNVHLLAARVLVMDERFRRGEQVGDLEFDGECRVFTKLALALDEVVPGAASPARAILTGRVEVVV